MCCLLLLIVFLFVVCCALCRARCLLFVGGFGFCRCSCALFVVCLRFAVWRVLWLIVECCLLLPVCLASLLWIFVAVCCV